MYREMIGTVADVVPGDQVYGTDGKWHEVKEVLQPFMPKSMYRFHTENGYVECTGDHLFNLWLEGKSLGNFDTATIFLVHESLGDSIRVGKSDGPKLLKVESMEPKLSCCIVVDSLDHQFEILAEKGQIG